MRKPLSFLLIFVVFLATSSAFSAEYTVKNGDNITKINRRFRHSVLQIMQMNPTIKNSDIIFAKQKITYIDRKDIKDARLWCQKRIDEIWNNKFGHSSLGVLEVKFFESCIKDLDKLKITYTFFEPSGIHFNFLLDFAESWRSFLMYERGAKALHPPPPLDLNITDEYHR